VKNGSEVSVCEATSTFVASGSWQTPTAAASLKLTSQRDSKHAKASASMVPLFTARANVPFRTVAALSEASISLRTLSRLTQRRQALCSISSRASCTWSRDDVKASRHPLVYKSYSQCGIRPASLFSTSTTRRLKIEDEVPSSSALRSGTEVGAQFSYNNSLCFIPHENTMSHPKADVHLKTHMFSFHQKAREFSILFSA
jgi:hypothetical protein